MNARDYERARSALAFIPPDDRDLWVSIGMALKDGFGDQGFVLWDAWSKQSDRYNERDARDVRKSLKAGGGITLGTLFHEAKVRGWRDNGTHQRPTPEELSARRREAAERTAKEKARSDREHAQAAGRATAIWDASDPAPGDHPYLISKRIQAPGLRLYRGPLVIAGMPCDGSLIVPVRDGSGAIHTLQFIHPEKRDGDNKRFLTGGAQAGGYWAAQALPDGDGTGITLLIGEGVATTLSACEATGYLGVAALSSGNLVVVAKAMRDRYPAAVLVILADLVKDTGLPDPHAFEAADAVGGRVVVPDFGPNRDPAWKDINDLVVHQGREAVRDAIASAKAPGGDASQESEDGGSGSQNKDDSAGSEESRLDAVAIHVLSGDPPTQRARPQADILIDIGLHVSKELFCSDDDRAYAVIRDRCEVWPIASKRFREWLRGCYFTKVGKGANSNSIRDAIETIAAKAQFSGNRRKVFLRTAEANGKLYVDLTDDGWRVVEIDAEDWRVLDQSPVMFTRRGSPAPLPVPETGGSLSELWPLLNVPEKYRPLVAGWLLAALYPSGPYPILVLQGEANAAKTLIAWMLRSLCDPSLVPLRPPTRDERDFLVSAIGNWCVCIDNVSGMQPWMSDALCRLSTGGGFAARTLYTDCDETAIQIERPVILNGVDVGAVRGDLLSRVVSLTLRPIPEAQRLAPDDLKSSFEKARPQILGALFTALAQAIREKPNAKLTRKPRMIGFARLVVQAQLSLVG